MANRTERLELAEKRLQSILRSHVAASDRILEQKISDAGPTNQRIDPHILTEARHSLIDRGIIQFDLTKHAPWYYLSSSEPSAVANRIAELNALHLESETVSTLLGQTLEIAVFRALLSQSALAYFGNFTNLDEHDDSTLYKKEEPPSFLSGRKLPGKKRLDFLVHHHSAGFAGIEIKNTRPWIYPNRKEVLEFLEKCCALDVVPVLIARRIHYSTFSVLNPCGVIIHETFNQLYPESAQAIALKVRDKRLLGYHDVRVGNQPDARLTRFIHEHLPHLLQPARASFDAFKDLLSDYANGVHQYKSFAGRVKRRLRGEPEDLPEFAQEAEEPPDLFE